MYVDFPLVSLPVAAPPPLLVEVSAPMEEPDCPEPDCPEPDVVPRLVVPPVYPPLPVVCAAAGSASMSESAPAAIKRVRILWISRALEPPRDNLS